MTFRGGNALRTGRRGGQADTNFFNVQMVGGASTMHLIRRFWLEGFLAAACIALAGQLAWPSLKAWSLRPRAGKQVPQESISYPYLVYLPRDYDSQMKWPLLLYLHGSGGRGRDLDADRLEGPPQLAKNGRHFRMIIASPQCPAGAHWDPERLTALLDHLEARFHPTRIMATGYSMGGSGTWQLAQHAPERLAAIAPICGCGDPGKATNLKNGSSD